MVLFVFGFWLMGDDEVGVFEVVVDGLLGGCGCDIGGEMYVEVSCLDETEKQRVEVEMDEADRMEFWCECTNK